MCVHKLNGDVYVDATIFSRSVIKRRTVNETYIYGQNYKLSTFRRLTSTIVDVPQR